MDLNLISTTDSIKGYEIIEQKGLVSSRVVVGVGFFSEFFASFTDFFGGRSQKLEDGLGELYLEAINNIELELGKKKCNALIGTRCDFDEISGKGTLMFMLTVTGTAVNAVKSADIVVQSPVMAIANGKRLERKLKDRPNIHTVCHIIDELLANLYLVDLELLIKAISQNSDVNETLDKNQLSKIISYLHAVFDKKAVSGVLINSLKENKANEAFDFVYMQCALPYFETMTDVLDSLNKETIEKYICPLENKPRADYKKEDAEAIDKYIAKLTSIGFDLNFSSEDEYLARMYGIKSKKDKSFINDLKEAIVQYYSQEEYCQSHAKEPYSSGTP